VGQSLLILLDTHVLIWLAQDYRPISSAAQSAIEGARQQERAIAVAGITFIEVARLASCGQVRFIPDVETHLREFELRFVVLPITADIALQALELPTSYPEDPADRIIGATAVVNGLTLVTADRAIRKSRAVPTIW
jgi:PIN domain nuclease of toxin-antitoxin system